MDRAAQEKIPPVLGIATCRRLGEYKRMTRIFFIGDIVGKPGRRFLKKRLPEFVQREAIDFVVANAENAAGGAGLTAAIAHEISQAGVDAITLGDHLWDQKGFAGDIDRLEQVCRPANLPSQCPGKTTLKIDKNGHRMGVFSVLGRTFMRSLAGCPFEAARREAEALAKDGCDLILAEIHAETTSEKVAFGWYMDGLVTAVVGTHTHIPTADAQILPRGTAYLTDAGMTGPYASVLGREVEPVVLRFLDGMPRRWPVAEGDVRLCGFLVEVDPAGKTAVSARQVTLFEDEHLTLPPTQQE